MDDQSGPRSEPGGRIAHEPPAGDPAARNRTVSCLRGLGIVVLVLVAIPAIPWLYLNYKYGREVRTELQRIRDAGEPVTTAEAAPKPVPDDQNAAILYLQVFHVSFDQPLPEETTTLKFGVLAPEDEKLLADYLWHPEATDAAAVRAILARPEVQDVLGLFERGSRMPYCVFPVHWEQGFAALFTHLARLRDAGRLISAQVQVLAASGQMDKAMHWSEVALRMSVQAASEPSTIAQLVAYGMQTIALKAAEQALDQGTPSPAVARQLADYAAGVDLKRPFHRGLLMERAVGILTFQTVAPDPDKLRAFVSDGQPSLALDIYASPLASPLRRLDEAEYLRYWQWAMPMYDEPYRMIRKMGDDWRQRIKQIPEEAVTTRLLIPVLYRIHLKRDAAIARIDELRIALALKEYKRALGSYPGSLADLAHTPGWPVPEDVFAGAPFHYRRQGEGFVLWSIGEDLQDDGGTPPKPRSNLAPAEADIVWECTR